MRRRQIRALVACSAALAGCVERVVELPEPSLPSGIVAAANGAGSHPALGLVSSVPSASALRVEWRAVDLPPALPPVAVFVGLDAGALLAEPPILVDPAASVALVGGLELDRMYFATLALGDGSGWVRVGPTLRARTSDPVHVRAGADPALADGASPSTAWPTLEDGLLQAGAAGGGNLWLSGTFRDVAAVVPAGVALYGGFPASFELAERDAVATPTLLVAAATSSVLTLRRADGDVAVVDGLSVDGAGISGACIDVDQRWCELRRIGAGSASRGFKLRSLDLVAPVEVAMVRCGATACGVGGVSIDGAFALLLEDCALSGNLQEGLTANSLIGLAGRVSRLSARDCVFNQNGSEGFDLDLATSGQLGGGQWEITLEDCEFVGNRLDGCLVDLDYEGQVGWTSKIEVRGCDARANGLAGMHFDIDAAASTYLHRIRASANGGDGVLVTSESARGSVVIDASVLGGNQGFGARAALGNVGLLLSNCVLTGNLAGGLEPGLAPVAATSSVAYIQAAPWSADEAHASIEAGASAPSPFLVAPRAWWQVLAVDGSAVTLDAAPNLGLGAVVEVAADDVARAVVAASGARVEVAPAPVGLVAPSVLAWFDSGPVREDWRPAPSSPALGAGMAPMGAPAVDAGPFGGSGGGAPGLDELLPGPLFRLADTDPSWTRSVASGDAIVLTFEGGAPDSATATASIDAIDAAGDPVPIVVAAAGSILFVTPLGAGWSTGDWLRVHGTLRSTDGRSLASAVAIPLKVAP